MRFRCRDEAEFFGKAGVALNNGKNIPKIAEILAGVGYTTEKMDEGLQVYKNAKEKYLAKERANGRKLQAILEFNKAWEEVKKSYMKHLKLARIVLPKENGDRDKLSLNGSRKKDYPSWSIDAKNFYTNALAIEEVTEKLEQLGTTADDLRATLVKLEELEELKFEKEKKIGEAKEATYEKRKAYSESKKWMSDYIAVVKLSVGEVPQLVESLGIFEKS